MQPSMAYSPSVSPSPLSFSLYLSVNLLQPAAQCTVEPRSAVHRGALERSNPWLGLKRSDGARTGAHNSVKWTCTDWFCVRSFVSGPLRSVGCFCV